MTRPLPLYTKQTIKGISLFSSQTFKKGDIILDFSAESIVEAPTQKTVQIGEHKHIFLSPDILQYTNHNCDPNIFFNTTLMHIECIKDIHINDEITFFYPSTEWSMSDPFECKCGTTYCIGTIKGAKDLDKTILLKYRIADYILEKERISTSR